MDHKFSPSYMLSQINEGNVIKAFKERIEKYYFNPIKKLLNKKIIKKLLNKLNLYLLENLYHY